MIIRSFNGKLMNINRSAFHNDTDYYLFIAKIKTGNFSLFNSKYISQEENLKSLEALINSK